MPRKAKALLNRFMSSAAKASTSRSDADATRGTSTTSDGSGASSFSRNQERDAAYMNNFVNEFESDGPNSHNFDLKSDDSHNFDTKSSVRRPRIGRRPLFITALAAVLITTGATAYAAYVNTGSGSGPGFGNGQLDTPLRSDVDNDTGNLFIADSGNDRIEIFAPDGASVAYLDQFTNPAINDPIDVAIDQSNGSIYVADTDDVVKFDSSFNLLGAFTSPGATGPIAVDPTDGDLLLADQATNTIKRFNSDGTPDGASPIDGSSSPGGAFTGLLDIAVNSTGDIYAVDANGPIESGSDGTPSPTGNSRVERFGAGGAHQASITPVGPNDRPARVAVDTATDTLYVSGEQDAIYRDAEATLHIFDSANTPIDSFEIDQGPPYIKVGGLAADPGPGKVYVVHDTAYWQGGGTFGSEPGILVFRDLALVPPTVATEPASAITGDSATLNGTVDPDGLPVDSCSFSYVDDAQFQIDGFASAESADCQGTGAASGSDDPVAVSADVSGLDDDTTYHYRVQAGGLGGSSTSSADTFATLGLPEVTNSAATQIGDATATLNGTVDPDGDAVSDCFFDYGKTASYGQTVPCAEDPGSGTDPTGVSAEISGLEPNTTYHFRLTAGNANGNARAGDATFKTVAAPLVLSNSSIDVSAETVTLRGRINPMGQQTSYQFEYGTDDSYGSVIPLDPASVGAGDDPVNVSRFLDGLEPETTYHFRLAATNATGTTNGPDRTLTTLAETVEPDQCENEEFRSGKSANLPDCRAYELVSPPDKNGADITQMTSRTRVADDGSAVAFESSGVFADAQGTTNSTTYLAERGDQGWQTHNIWPKIGSGAFNFIGNENAPGYHFSQYDADLSHLFFVSHKPLPGTPEAAQDLMYLYQRTDARSPGAGNFELLTGCDYDCSAIATPFRAPSFIPTPAGVSSDRSKVLVNTYFPLTADAPANTNAPKLFLVEDGNPTWVGQIPAGDDTACGGGGPACVQSARAHAMGMNPGNSSVEATRLARHHFLSDSGERIFFSVSRDSNGQGNQGWGDLYQRDTQGTPSTDDDTTVKLNVSELDSPEPSQPGSLQYMSPNGEYATFTSQEQLTDDAIPGANATKLYLWSRQADGEGHHLTYIAGGGTGGSVDAVIAQSEDAKDVYFQGDPGLVSGETPPDSDAAIYHWNAEDGLSYVGRANQTVTQGWRDNTVNLGLNIRLSDDGSKLLVSSTFTLLEGHGQSDCQGDMVPCRQLYLYDADGGETSCISCPPSGADAAAQSWTFTEANKSAVYRGINVERMLSSDGRYAFFTTTQALLPEDTNGPCEAVHPGFGPDFSGAPCADVYSYDTETGELALLSTGKDDSGSYFLDATPDGSTVLIGTRERLVGTDVDGSYDVYAVKVNGGLASQHPAEPDPPCTDAETCRGEADEGPPEEPIGSDDLEGDGNPVVTSPADCTKLEQKASKLKHRHQELSVKTKKASGKKAKKLRQKAKRAKQRQKSAKQELTRCKRGES